MSARHTPYFNLLDALKSPGCALCALSRRAIDNSLDNMLYEYVNDTSTQEALVAAHGFCATHSELLLGYRGALGIAILYNAVLRHLEGELPAERENEMNWLGRLTGQRGRGEVDSSPLAAHAPCPACKIRDETAERALTTLQEHVADAGLVAALQASEGFCLPHLRQGLTVLAGPARRLTLRAQRQGWQTIQAQLAEFIRKNDYRFQQEGFTAEEEDVWRRAVRAISGAPGVF
jgi:hypothetical protein